MKYPRNCRCGCGNPIEWRPSYKWRPAVYLKGHGVGHWSKLNKRWTGSGLCVRKDGRVIGTWRHDENFNRLLDKALYSKSAAAKRRKRKADGTFRAERTHKPRTR